ncbi:MAG: hypothetical protein BGO37_02635 [Cellulomonas sp. 73-92]|uniref:hypothetical protein n=1 Tax=Cellulomonas sp. 73-92 TaxID=1895740 RepID=UPI00092B70D2|nr:hypothetical protein [Cellulomonas sp. 73-92]OJV80288.1 MAG: hypothetical protein BGO37_02635 [Cellulomonas sp. 73-92]
MAAKKGTWIGGTLFAAAVIGAATWFGAVHPTLSDAAALRAQTDDVNRSNQTLQTKVTQLAADFQKLPQYKQQLEALRIQVPTTAQLSDYVRQVQQIATAHTVVVTSFAPSTPQAVVVTRAAAPAATPTPSPTASASPSASATADPATPASTAASAAAASGVPAGMAAIPVSITVVGTYDNTLAFLNDLQTGIPRVMLVSGFTGTSQKDAAASGGKPATHVGDQELVVTGFLYVLPDPTAATPAPSPTAPVLPAPAPGKNPLVPVAGK